MPRGQLKMIDVDQDKSSDVELEDASAIYHGHVQDRMEHGKMEKKAKNALEAMVERRVTDKTLKLPPEAADGRMVVVHEYERDGQTYHVHYGKRIKVAVRLAKEAKPGDPPEYVDDDGPETVE